jgi:hypothetical protein
MQKPLQIVCLTGAALLVAGAFLLAASGPIRSTRQTESAARAAAPALVAMQENPTIAQQRSQRQPASDAGWIGVSLEDKNGVRVSAVFPGGPAAFAGLRAGDALIGIGGARVESMSAAHQAIERLAPGRASLLTVQRGGKTVELKVTPDSSAEFHRHYVAEMMRRDPRDPKYGQHHGVSSADMSAELVRRLFEQNERLDRTLHEVLKEVRSLRKQVAGLQK